MDSLAATMADMLVDMTSQPDLQATVDRLSEHALRVASADAASVLLFQSRRLQTVAATDPSLLSRADSPTSIAEGPSQETTGHPGGVYIRDLRAEGRWPQWCADMIDRGWRSTLTFRLSWQDRTLGSLILFARAADAFAAEHIDTARIFSQNASVVIAVAQQEHQLTEAIGTRHLIGLAQGILMQRYGVEVDAAFDILKRYSQDRNVKLRDVAAHVVKARELPTASSTSLLQRV